MDVCKLGGHNFKLVINYLNFLEYHEGCMSIAMFTVYVIVKYMSKILSVDEQDEIKIAGALLSWNRHADWRFT